MLGRLGTIQGGVRCPVRLRASDATCRPRRSASQATARSACWWKAATAGLPRCGSRRSSCRRSAWRSSSSLRISRDTAGSRPPRQPPIETFPPNPTVDFKVGRLALGQDESELETGPRYVLLVYDLEGGVVRGGRADEPATFAARATREQLRALSRNICRGGRRRAAAVSAVRRADGQQQKRPHGCVRSQRYHHV